MRAQQNPDDARFCSQLRRRARRRPPAPRRRVADERDRDDQRSGRPGRDGRHVRPARSTRSTRPRSTRCRPGTRPARRAARPERRQPVPARRRRHHGRPAPGQRHLPRRRDRLAPARGVPPRPATASRCADVGSLNGTYVNRDRIDDASLTGGDEVQIGKYRLVFFPSQRGQPEPVGRRAGVRPASGPALMSIGEVLDAAAPRLPRRHDLQDPLPRGRGTGRAGADAVGLPQVHATTTSSGCATSCAAQRDHYLPLKVIREHLDAIDRGLEPPPLEPVVPTVPDGRAGRRRAARAPSRSARRDDLRLSRTRAAQDRRDRPRSCSTSSSSTAWSRRARHRPLRRRRPGHRPDGARAGRLRPRAPPPARVQDRGRPRGRPGRAGRRPACAAAQTRRPRPRAEEAVRELAALSVRLHAALVKAAAARPSLSRRWRAARPRARGVGWRRARSSTSSASGSRCPRTSRSCCCARSAGERYLPIWIGAVEATAIAFAQQGVVPPRPLTHDLLQGRARGHRPRAHRRSGSPSCRTASSTPTLVFGSRRRGQRPALRRDRARAAHRHAASSAPRRCSTRPASPIPDEQEDEVEKFREFLDQVTPEDFDGRRRTEPHRRLRVSTST